jgi:hypothetical protein
MGKHVQSLGWRLLDSSGAGFVPVVGACEYGNNIWDSTKCEKCLDQLRNC